MKNIQKLALIAAVAALVSACNFRPDPLIVDIPEGEKMPVISTSILPIQGIAVTFSKTFSALVSDNDSLPTSLLSDILVDSAEVEIRWRGEKKQLQKLAPGIFATIDVPLIDNEKYALFARDILTGQTVSAETTLLPAVDFDSIEVLGDAADSFRLFEMHLRDLAGQPNFYLLSWQRLGRLPILDSLNIGLFNTNRPQIALLTDEKTGDGEPISFTPMTFFGQKGDTLLVSVANIPQDYFEFLTAYRRSGNVFQQLLSEPIKLPTNVEGGFGYFAMTRTRPRLVVLR